MKQHQQNGFVRCLLRTIDICVGMYLLRSVRWDEEPFRKATEKEWRIGSFLAACFPICILVFGSNSTVQSFLDTAGGEGYSIVWPYIGVMVFVSIGALGLFKIGPKIPIYISMPAAAVAWIYCVWLFGFHSEKLIHSS